MTMVELWGYIELLLRNLGMWDTMTAALSVIVVISLASFALGILRR